MDHNVKSLLYVVEAGTVQLKQLVARLDHEPDSKLEPILRSIAKEADTLSAGLTRLSAHAETLPESVAEEQDQPAYDPELFEAINLAAFACQRGFCDQCGGVKPAH